MNKLLASNATELTQEYGSSEETTERKLQLIKFLTLNKATRKAIFERLAIYYNTEEGLAAIKSWKRASRMLERDLAFLQKQGYEIVRTKVGRETCYNLTQGTGQSPLFIFSDSEVASIALLYNLVADSVNGDAPGSPFAENILALVNKLTAALPAEQLRQFKKKVVNPLVRLNLNPMINYLPYIETIEIIEKAIFLRQQIRFDYFPAHRRQETVPHEKIDPYHIQYQDGHFYFYGYAHKKHQPGFLEYRLDRIKPDTIKILSQMIDIERQPRLIEFSYWLNWEVIKSGGVSNRWVSHVIEREEIYLDEQSQEKRRVLVRAKAYNEWRVRQQLLKYGDQAELVEPPEMRERMQHEVARMYKFYNK